MPLFKTTQIISEVKKSGGCASWFKDEETVANPTLNSLWNEEIQKELKRLGYGIEITPAQDVYNSFSPQIRTEPEMITVMSPEYIKREYIKNKMKKEFGT